MPSDKSLAVRGDEPAPEPSPEARPFAAGPGEDLIAPRAPEPAPDGEEPLPADILDAPGVKAASAAARADIDRVVLRPGRRFMDGEGGVYLDVKDLSHVVRVVPGSVIPDGLYLISEQYLLRGVARDRAIGGRA